jgi:UDP-2,4-diacetamido-2,4,6-trideoxy-beta-L-altropyranose hydrolase
MKIAIRADGGMDIGMGHIMRTLVLAKELSKCHDVFYVCRIDNPLSNRYKIGIEKVKSQGFAVKTIREDFILCDLVKLQADVLITDSYDVNEKYFDETKKMFNKTGYIDDMNLYKFNVDFLINQNVNAIDFRYKVNKDTKLFIGPRFIMLRDEFRRVSEKHIKEKVEDVMITVGGADLHHITEQILNYVKLLDYNFHVVVGSSFSGNDSLKNFESEKIRFYYNADMYKIMEKCDIAISACGSTLYELAVCGVPTVGLIIADNQQRIANKMDELGIIKNVGWYDKLNDNKFIWDFNNLCGNFKIRVEMNRKAREAVDGDGVKRIVRELEALI